MTAQIILLEMLLRGTHVRWNGRCGRPTLSMLRLTMSGVIVTGTHFRRVTSRTLATTNPAGMYTRIIVRIRLYILPHYRASGIENNF